MAASIRETDDSKSAISIEKDCINIIQTEGFKAIIEKVRNKFMKQDIVETKGIYKVLDKYLSGKIPLLIYIIINCILENPILLNRTIALFRHIQRNHSNVFIESFSLALQQCRIDNSEISFQILLIIESCYGSYILNKNDVDEILNYYINNNELYLIPFIINERFVIPEKDSLIDFSASSFAPNFYKSDMTTSHFCPNFFLLFY